MTKYPDGNFYERTDPGIPDAKTDYPLFKSKNNFYKPHNQVAVDKEMDHFAFQFNGKSGVFVLGKGQTGTESPAILGDSKLKIWFDTDDGMMVGGKRIRTTIKAFYIQDENGLVYHFTELALAKIIKTSFCAKNFKKQAQPKFKNHGVYFQSSYDDNDPSIVHPYIVNGWHLTKIEDILTNRSINLTYYTRDISANVGSSIANYDSESISIFTKKKNYSIITHSNSVAKTPVINTISFEDGHNVKFNYGNNRIDLNGDLILSFVDIEYKGRKLSRYEFNTTYFIKNRLGQPGNEKEKKAARLCLRSVRKIGVDLKAEEKPYIFDYYVGSSIEDDIVPPPFSHMKDIWGYYNGSNSPVPINKVLPDLSNSELKALCFVDIDIYNAKNEFAKNGLLKQVIYPTGGSLRFEYEQNTASFSGQNKMAYGVHVSKTSLSDGGYSNNCDDAITANYKFKLANGQSSLWGQESPINTIQTSNYYKPEDKQWFKVKLFPPSVGCDHRFKYPGILSRDQVMNPSFGGEALQFALNVYSTYATIQAVLATFSGDPVTLIIQLVVDFVVTCFINPQINDNTLIHYNSDLTSSNPLPLQFKRVEVIENEGASGKKIVEFTSNDDYPVWFNSNPIFSSKQRYAYWAYGLPKVTTVYDSSGNKISEVENIYEDSLARREFKYNKFPKNYYSYKSFVVKSSSQKIDNWKNPNLANRTEDMTSNADMKVDSFTAYSGRALLTKSTEKIFKPGEENQFLLTTNEYKYNQGGYDDNYEINEIKTTQSNGDINFKYLTYENFANQNIFALPKTVATSFKKNGSSSEYFTGESVTEYTTLNNGNIVPSGKKVQRFKEPKLSSAMTFYPANLNIAYKPSQTFYYDGHTNLSGIMDEGQHVVTNIYDYDDKYISATVINAHPQLDKIAYTSFETINFDRSGWQRQGGTDNDINNSITGLKGWSLSNGQSFIANALNISKSYKLSFWATNNSITANNATLIKSGPQLHGFTYYEYRITAGTPSVTITGNAVIDELRLYPENARMSTIAYDPLIGKISECDENNRITYYEYDESGRLRFIKDEHKNIVKMYEYNEKSKSAGCPATFTNLQVREIFVKNNCAAGYIGSEVLYNIPEGKYTSLVSQDEVDHLIQLELDSLGQAYANDSGSCIKVFYNIEKPQEFIKGGCDIGFKGTSVIYILPDSTYSSTLSQEDADEQAQDDLDANGDAFVNLPGNASCVIDYEPSWEGEENSPTQCQKVNGVNTGHQLVLVKDINPNSSTYNQTEWVDMGINLAACPMQTCEGENKKIINGVCEVGIKVYTASYDEGSHSYCVYHFEWSDGSWSQNYTIEVPFGLRCAVDAIE